MLRKCTLNGQFVCTIPGFTHIRGIGRDKDDFYYIVDSFKSRILKFDADLNPLRKTCIESAELFREPFGIFVDEEYIYVCSSRENHICVLDSSLKVCYLLKLSFSPTDITKFDGKYFVTTKSTVVMIDDVNFTTRTFRETKFQTMTRRLGKPVSFKNCELRGICASEEHLYVTEKCALGRLLRLKFYGGQLKYIDAVQNCTPPNAVTYNNGAVYYSRGVWGMEFSIMKVMDNNSFRDTKLFDA